MYKYAINHRIDLVLIQVLSQKQSTVGKKLHCSVAKHPNQEFLHPQVNGVPETWKFFQLG